MPSSERPWNMPLLIFTAGAGSGIPGFRAGIPGMRAPKNPRAGVPGIGIPGSRVWKPRDWDSRVEGWGSLRLQAS